MRIVVLAFAFMACVALATQQSRQSETRANGAEQHSRPKSETSSLEKASREPLTDARDRPDPNAAERLAIDRELKEYTRQLADYTKKLAEYTQALAIATTVLGFIAVLQFFTSKVAGEAIPKIERAYVFPVCNGSMSSVTAVSIAGKAEVRCQNVRLDVELLNHGRTPAVLADFECWAEVFGVKYSPIDIGIPPRYKSGRVLASESAEEGTDIHQIPIDLDAFERARKDGVPIKLRGTIVYMDMLGKRRKTSFVRDFNAAQGRLFLPDDEGGVTWT